jgi:TonB-dependent starch-binding outer membrane protein SusC
MEKKSIHFLGASRKTFFSLPLIFVLFLTLPGYAQTATVSGVIRDVSGNVVEGVNVMVKGGVTGTTSDNEGHYSISVPNQNAFLLFSSAGYISKEEKVGSRTSIDVTLNQSTSNLDEVVVIGYGTQRKRDVTGAITSVTAKQIEERQAVNLQDALQGQAAGLLIINDAGEPGAEGTIQIRGGSTFSSAGNSPLYVIDGVVGANPSMVNPNDIQSLDVLKDAASAAIYGSRAANGVIIITTKKGVDGKPKIEARYLHTFGKLAHKLRQANADEVRLYRNEQAGNLSGTSGGSNDSLNPGFNADNDYQALLTQMAQKNQYDLSLSGGSKTINYYNSLRYVDDKGLILNSWAKLIQLRSNIDFQPSKRFKYSTRFTFGYRNRNDINEGNTINQTFQRPTNFRLYYPDGSLTGYVGGRRNPLSVALFEINEDQRFEGTLFNQIEYELLKDLKFTTNFAVNYEEVKDLSFSPKILSSNNPLTNSGSEGFSRQVGWEYQGYLNYTKTIHNDHKLTGLAGFSAEREQYNSSHIEGKDYVSEEVLSLNAAQTIAQSDAEFDAYAHSLASVFGRLGYSYKGKYTFSGTLRYDGSSRFGKENRWGLFPSAAVAWRFSDESFMNWASNFLTDGKLRVSFGRVGNERIGNYDAILRYGFGSYFYNGVSGIAFGNSYGNPALSWESTDQTNVGLDLSFLKGRLNITTDYYVKTTNKLLYNRPLPRETGFQTVRINLGSLETKGFEFSVNAIPMSRKDFEWNVIANFSTEQGTVKELFNGESFIAGNSGDGGNAGWLISEGGKLGDFYGWKALGVYAYDESNAYTESWEPLTPVFDGSGTFTGYTLDGKEYTGTVKSISGKSGKLTGGDIEFVDVNKDGMIDDNDRMVLGNAQPDFYAAIINTLRYKAFSLSFTFNTVWGNQIYNNAAQSLNNYGTTHIIPQPYIIYNAWRSQGDITDVPEVRRKNNTGNMRMNDRYLEDGSFIRLAYVRLTYNLKKTWAKKVFANNLNAYIYGSNLATWTNYSWFDPEFSSRDPLQQGQDNGRYPRRREIGLGLNVNF